MSAVAEISVGNKWPSILLSTVAEVTAGGPAPQEASDFSPNGTPFVRMQDVGKEHHCPNLLDTVDHISHEVAERKRLRLFRKGSLLIPKSGASVNLNHRALLGVDAYVVSHLAVVIPDRTKLDAEYLYFWSLTYDPRHQAQVTSLPSLPLSLINKAEIPLPSFSEQRRIVDILKRADGIRRLRKQAIQTARELIPALFVDMFGDPATNPKGWPEHALGDLCNLVRGSSPRPQGNPRYFGGPVPRLMIADITRDGIFVTPRIDSLTIEGAKKSRPMKAGDVVMAVSGAVGLPAILAVDACIHDGFVGFREMRTDLISTSYLYSFLQSLRHRAAHEAVGAIFQNLTTDQIKRWTVPLPSRQLQDEFNRQAEQIRAIERQQEDATCKVEATFSALLHRAFRGEF